ncbi:MAG TPA: phosphatase PAP2 family protein [Phycisphaerales bacterium]|nr:phosphatase PAP2 family protein [Phycisphaerales bacterium]
MSRNPGFRISWEHNRGLATPIRALHPLWALWSPAHRRLNDPRRRAWAPPLLYGLLAVLILWPLDGRLSAAIAPEGRAAPWLGGDLRRELEALQQFGQGTITLAIAAAIWMLDPSRRRRLLDWLAAVAIAAALAFGLKMLLGRPRPVLGEPDLLLGPFGMYPLGPGQGIAHAWEFWREDVSKLWSMPSSHTVFAVVAAGMLTAWYPRLRALMIGLVLVVALGRLLLGGHYASDIAAGVAVGLIAVGLARRWRPSGDGGPSPASSTEPAAADRAAYTCLPQPERCPRG